MRSSLLIVPALLWFATCLAAQPQAGASAVTTNANALLQGRFDNRDQAGKPSSDPEHAMPHVTIAIEPTAQADWSLWHVHLETDAQSSFDQTWAMQARAEYDGSGALIPYYQLQQTQAPAAAAFDPLDWLSLEACALRGQFKKNRIEGMSEGEPCVAVSMGVGARRALLPVGIVREGEWLHVDLNLRGVRTRIDAKRLRGD